MLEILMDSVGNPNSKVDSKSSFRFEIQIRSTASGKNRILSEFCRTESWSGFYEETESENSKPPETAFM